MLGGRQDVMRLTARREFTALHESGTARLDTDQFNQRTATETVYAPIEGKFGSVVRSRDW